MSKKKPNRIDEVLKNWFSFVQLVPDLTEEELEKALKKEMSKTGQKRKMYATRLHQRICRLRGKREREEILKVCKQ